MDVVTSYLRYLQRSLGFIWADDPFERIQKGGYRGWVGITKVVGAVLGGLVALGAYLLNRDADAPAVPIVFVLVGLAGGGAGLFVALFMTAILVLVLRTLLTVALIGGPPVAIVVLARILWDVVVFLFTPL